MILALAVLLNGTRISDFSKTESAWLNHLDLVVMRYKNTIDSKAWPHRCCWITIFYQKENICKLANKQTFLKYVQHEVNWNISTHQSHHRHTPATRPFGPDSEGQRVLDHCHLSWQTERGACSAVNWAAPPFLLPAFCTNDGVLSVLQLSPIRHDTLTRAYMQASVDRHTHACRHNCTHTQFMNYCI